MGILKNALKYIMSVIGGGLLTTLIWYNFYEAPELSYQVETNLFQVPQIDKDNNVTFSYKNKNFENFYLTLVTITNAGGIVLERDDYKNESNPLRIEGCSFFSYYFDDAQSNVSSKVKLKKKDDALFIYFPYMNPKDVIQIKLLHTKKCTFTVKGSLKNISKIEKQKSFQEQSYYLKKKMGIIFGCLSILMVILCICISYFIDKNMKKRILHFYINEHFKENKKDVLFVVDSMKDFDKQIEYISKIEKSQKEKIKKSKG